MIRNVTNYDFFVVQRSTYTKPRTTTTTPDDIHPCTRIRKQARSRPTSAHASRGAHFTCFSERGNKRRSLVNRSFNETQTYLSAVTNGRCDKKKRRWLLARKIKVTTSLLGYVRWQIVSGGDAVIEKSVTAGRRISATGARLGSSLIDMAESKFQEIKRSISSWSLSTIKKPKLSGPKFKKPKLNIFTNKRKNRADQEVTPNVEVSNEYQQTVGISNTSDEQEVSNDSQPKIVVTLPDDRCVTTVINLSDGNINVKNESDSYEEHKISLDYVNQTLDTKSENVTDAHSGVNVAETNRSVLKKTLENNDILFIDDNSTEDDVQVDNEVKQDKKWVNIPSTVQVLNRSNDGADSWCDARSSLTAFDKDLHRRDLTDEEDENYSASNFYDISDSQTLTPQSEKSYDDLQTANEELDIPSSIKAREWVKSYDEDPSKRADETLHIETQSEHCLPRSKSDLELSVPAVKKWNKKEEIVLNLEEGKPKKGNSFFKFFNKSSTKVSDNDDTVKHNSKEAEDESAKREGIKKIFGVRRKLSIKSPIVDSKTPTYKDSDIYIAATPYALKNTVKNQENQCFRDSKGSLDVSDDAILYPLSKCDDDKNSSKGELGDRDELEKEIEKLLGDGKGPLTEPVPDSQSKVSKEINESSSIKHVETTAKITVVELGSPENDSTVHKISDFETLSNSLEEELSEYLELDSCFGSVRTDVNEHDFNDMNVLDKLMKSSKDKNIVGENLKNVDNCDEKTKFVDSIECDQKLGLLQSNIIDPSNVKDNSNNIENVPTKDSKLIECREDSSPVNVDLEGNELAEKLQAFYDDESSEKKVNEPEMKCLEENAPNVTLVESVSQNVDKNQLDELNNGKNQELNEKTKKGKHYFSKTLKNIKGNIFPEESKGKSDKKKLKIKFTSFGKKGKEKINEVEISVLEVPQNSPMPTLFEGQSDNEVNEEINTDELSESRSENELRNDDELNELILKEESKNLSFEIDIRDKTKEVISKEIIEEASTSKIHVVENSSLLETASSRVSPEYSMVNKQGKESTVHAEVKSSEGFDNTLQEEIKISDSQPVIAIECNQDVINKSSDDLEKKESFTTADDQEFKEFLEGETCLSVNKDSNIKWEDLSPSISAVVDIESEKSVIINDSPKAKPRTKKNKYGYTQSEALPNAESCEQKNSQLIPVIVINPETEERKGNCNSEDMKLVPRITASNDSGNHHNNEPIYWEIDPQPKPSPRKKKLKSKQDIRDGSNLSINSTGSTSSASKQGRNSSGLPDWIQQRPPIPCPRGKKQKSTLNLQSNDSCDVKTLSEANVFGNSFSNIVFKEETITNKCNRWAGDDFYSGKAASIAYGVTSNVKNESKVLDTPMIKQSLTSLKGVAQNKEPSDLILKRQRRRTAPGGSPLPAPRHQHTKSTVQALTDGLFHFTEILASIGVGDSIQNKTEELLSDVLFAVFSLMGPEDNCTWGLCLPMEQNGTTSAYVSLGQVKTFLKEAFQVSTEKMERIVADVKNRQVADVSLKLKVLEAKELRPKTVKGGSNPYATVSIPSTQQSCRTRLEHETLSPKWNQEFTLSVKNMHKDVIQLQVWHEFDAHITNHFSEVKDVQSALRLLKGTNALAHKQEAHLLGSVQVPVKQIKENGIDDWFPLEKITPKEERKSRGQVHIKGEVTAANSKKNYGERRSYDALLARFVYHYIKTITNNNAEEEALQIPWRGQLSPEAVATLAQHSIILGLNGPLQHFSWWIVGSRVPSADAGWQLNQLQKVQNNMTSKSYSESDLENLSDSFYNWIKFALYKLRNLRASFPTSSGVIAKRQFASLLRICVNLQSHPESNLLLQTKGIVDLLKQVGTAVTDYAKEWWTNLVEEQLRGVIKPEEQIKRVVTITTETFTFLEEVALFYGPTLLSEVNIPYFREIFIMLTTRLNPCIRPPLMNIYSHLTQNHDCHQDVVDNVTDNLVSFVFENGSLLWTLYINLGRINGLGNDLPKEIREESGIYDYHKWFNKAVRRWVDLAKQRALAMINKAVELDNFEAIDEYCNFSSSATDVIGIFTEVQIWWKYLSWPDPENSMVLLAKILEDICSYGMTYADLLKNKVENMFSDNPNSHELSLSKQICTGLNNIDRVKNDINNLPDMFGVNLLSEKIRASQTGGEEVANRFIENVNTLIENSAENMEAKVNEFIEVVIEKMGGALHNAVVEACEVSSDKPLLVEVLDPALKVIHSNMNDSNFRMFLHRLWDMLIHLFKVTVTQNTDKKKASYFNGVYSIIENCLKFVSPSDGAGLTNEEAKSEEYYELVELLQCLRLSSEHLIAKYYSERYEEQNLHSNPGRGELVARAYFTKSGKLTVEIIMAKDMQLNHECGSLSTLASQFSSQSQYVDAYVKVNLVPSEWFHNVHEVRTKIQRKSDPAVFEETFDFEVTQEDSDVDYGFILLTLKDHNLGRSNTLIGEALIPLKDLSCVDSNLDHGVQNMYLKITTPGIESGYQSLRALKLRTSDRVATTFLKRNGGRISVDNKFKGINNLNPEDDKPRSRSPRLLHKIFA